MQNYKDLLQKIITEGEERDTRSGKTRSIFGEHLAFDLRAGFPAVTTKKLAFKSMAGELLWFLNGKTDLPSLRKYSDLSEDAWTIWTNDCLRWHQKRAQSPAYSGEMGYTECNDVEDLGELYGYQWRTLETEFLRTIDQMQNLITSIKENPSSRYHIVCAWNATTVALGRTALAPCHVLFQCYVTDKGELDLMWYQRSVDTFLGLPFNIASYALLSHIICELTGLTPRYLKCTLGDVHVYEGHLEAVSELLSREPKELPKIRIPKLETLDDLKGLTAKDFELVGYEPHGPIKAPLSVGV